MKKRVHHKLIKAWADGAEVQIFIEKDEEWVTVSHPSWEGEIQYRIKPREFKGGDCYPAITLIKDSKVLIIYAGNDYFCLNGEAYHVDEFRWIGDKLSDKIWEGSDA